MSKTIKKVKFNHKFIKVIEKNNFISVEEPWCNNQGVTILPYVLKDNEYYYLLVKEYNPSFEDKQISEYSTITGEVENKDHYTTIINEMLEEVNINVNNTKVKIQYFRKALCRQKKYQRMTFVWNWFNKYKFRFKQDL